MMRRIDLEVGEEERMARMTDPDATAVFVEQGSVDILILSIGNVHRLYRAPPIIDLERSRTLRQRVVAP